MFHCVVKVHYRKSHVSGTFDLSAGCENNKSEGKQSARYYKKTVRFPEDLTMSDYGDNIKYKWTPESTTLLVSVWGDKQVQKQLAFAHQGPQLIWESVARYMTKKGYTVSAKQCRSRMKQVLVCYREAKRAGTKAGVEQYYESIDRVLKNKKCESNEDYGIDTVDATVQVKSPPKDVKTSKNLKMRFNKYSEPIESLIRTEALSPIWHLAQEEEYPDSPESNETVLAQPYRAFSPTRDAATNTLNGRSQLLTKGARRSLDEGQIQRESRSCNTVPNNRFGEMLYQNAVQNVQNQIIQENMQHRNLLQSQFPHDEEIATMMPPEQLYRCNEGGQRNDAHFTNEHIATSKLRYGRVDQQTNWGTNEAPNIENTVRMQNQLQQTCPIDNRAVPQEPRRNFAPNLEMNYKHYKEAAPRSGTFFGAANNAIETRQRTAANYSPETAVNLNEAFCQVNKNERNHRLMNDSYEQQQQPTENEVLRAMNATTITNNATFNDDTISIEFLEGSRSPSDNGAANGNKRLSVSSDRMPSVPARKKKAQKLEQLVINAITSQTEVVNKILAAQDAMVTRFLDLDRDRQNRLENRLDHLMNVVHATVMNNKSPDKETDANVAATSGAHHEEPLITSLAPPPRPGAIPPKLDLVPPKPCRVPCTTASANIELINQNPVVTRPGVVSPSKPPQPGAIWSKLGPVSQSPFVKAQQQLGIRACASNIGETRTQSSAERRIAREMESLSLDRRAVIFETQKFLEIEKHTEEQTENARIIAKMSQEVAARRKLFESRAEPNPGIILSAAFLDAERHVSSNEYACPGRAGRSCNVGAPGVDEEDEDLLLLAGQVDNYERLRRLNFQSLIPEKPCDTSTPAKPANAYNEERIDHSPKQTIQQLADLVMKSARWRDAAIDKADNRFTSCHGRGNEPNAPTLRTETNAIATIAEAARSNKNIIEERKSYAAEMAERESRVKAMGWIQDRYSYGNEKQQIVNDRVDDRRASHDVPNSIPPLKSYPMGFTTEYMNRENRDNPYDRRVAFDPDLPIPHDRKNLGFEKVATLPRGLETRRETTNVYDDNRAKYASLPTVDKNMIDRYIHETRPNVVPKNSNDKAAERDSDGDEEFLDTTMSMQPQPRKSSLTSNGTSGKVANCIIS